MTMCAIESVTLRKEDLRPADPPFAAIGAAALLRRLAFAGHLKDGGSPPLHLTDLQNLKKESNFSARFDSI